MVCAAAAEIDGMLDVLLHEQRGIAAAVDECVSGEAAAMETVTSAGLACIRKMGAAMEAYSVPQDLQRMTSELVRCKRLLSAAEISAADSIQECETLNEALATKDKLLVESQARERQLEDERRRWTAERREHDRRLRLLEAENKRLEETLIAQNNTSVDSSACGLSTSYSEEAAEVQALRGQLEDLRGKYSEAKRELTMSRLMLKEAQAGQKRSREPIDDPLNESMRSASSSVSTEVSHKQKYFKTAAGGGLPPRQPPSAAGSSSSALRDLSIDMDEVMH